jgi:hypothetical protein
VHAGVRKRTGAFDLVHAVVIGKRDLLVSSVVKRETVVGKGLISFGVARAVVQLTTQAHNHDHQNTHAKWRASKQAEGTDLVRQVAGGRGQLGRAVVCA